MTRQFLYVLASDQSQEKVDEQQSTDGGWHVPHLFGIDLAFVDLTVQQSVTDYATGVTGKSVDSYRFNKVIKSEFDPDEFGAAAVESTLGQPSTPLTRVSGATTAEIGEYYPGEFQLEPTARTRMHFVNNPTLSSDPNRLYIGTTGETQSSETNALLDPAYWKARVGGLIVLSVDSNGVPSYRDTLTVEQEATHPYQVSSIDVVPSRWAIPNGRNVLLVGSFDGRPANDELNPPQDRIILIQDK